MSLRPIALFAAVCFSATLAQAAGLRFIEVPADAAGPALRGAVWYPCDAPAGAIALGPAITLQGTKDCPMKVGQWPLVVISHGAGGSFIAHRDTAAALADAGFVAAAISHAGDNFQDLSAHEDLSIFVSRPMDMKRLIDFVLKRWPEHIDADSIGFFGFSRGGYTGLALAGADPDFRIRTSWCQAQPEIRMCVQARRNELPTQPPVHDTRIKAAVIADPLSFFNAEGLKNVKIPILLWASQHGGDGVLPEDVAAVRRGLSPATDFRVQPGSAHFAFLAPCSAPMANDMPEICNDAPGFDRLAFHDRLNAEVTAFFRQHLGQPTKP
jgi:predicted dienelactone hydrolase